MIIPQTVFNLYKDVPFNSDYKHTIYFKTRGSQLSYFANKLSNTFDNFTYIRQSGSVSIPGVSEQFYECNYCSFKNIGYGDKWFYAFVTGVNYINDSVTEIQFEIDLIQTWLFDFIVGKCFVEREHVVDDTIGKHTLPENLPFGECVTLSTSEYKYTPTVIVKYAPDGGYKSDVINNIYDPLITEDDPSAIADLLDNLSDKPERVAFIKMGCQEHSGTLAIGRTGSVFRFNDDSYQPVNNKLYTYPYTGIYLDDYGGNNYMYRWEDFENPLQVTFSIQSITRPVPINAIVPQKYRGNINATQYMVVKTDFPDCPYIIDNFRAWLASVGAKQSINYQAMLQQQTVADTKQIVGTILGAATSAANNAASPAMAGIKAAQSATMGAIDLTFGRQERDIQKQAAKESMSVDFNYADAHGVSIGGQFGGNLAPWCMGLIGWRLISVCIKPEYARTIDDFFTRFGYKCNRFKVPNLSSRQSFNYVKTIDCNIVGNVPNYASVGISNIFDNGITLWHTTDVGNYTLLNDTTGVGSDE